MAPVIRLIQADDLDAWQRALLVLCLPPAAAAADRFEPPVVVVPNRAAGEQWRRTLEQRVLGERWEAPRALQQALGHVVEPGAPGALVMPRLLTRDELYDAWHRDARLADPRLSPLVREVLMAASARRAARAHPPPFLLRPGLIAEMVRLHDTVARLGHEATRWLETATAQLEGEAEGDRGAQRLLLQTAFLRHAFHDYDGRLARAGGLDERGLRAALRAQRAPWCGPHVVVTVGDHHAEADGLWPVDLDLLAAAPGVARLDIVATHRTADGCFERLARLWPAALDVRIARQRPAETVLEVTSVERRWIACRDREEEVLACARRIKALAPADASSHAIVYRRPLPYLYAAQAVLDASGISYQSSGTLPLAAEPWAAGLDLLMDAALSGFTRASLVTLLRSPHVALGRDDGTIVGAADVAAFDAWLARQRYLGTLAHLDHLLAQPAPSPPHEGADGAGRYAQEWREDRAARSVGAAVRPWLAGLDARLGVNPGADHVRALRDAWRACERVPRDDDPEASRTRRTRAAVDALLGQLEDALGAHDPAPVPARDTCILVRRWIEERTFALPRRDDGVHLVDAGAARYGHFDHVRVVGLLEGEWPEPTAHEIFYPAFMLAALGWPEERTRTRALRASFADLLTLPAVAVGVSVPELDQDAVVRPSALLDELMAVRDDRLRFIPADEAGVPVTREDALLVTPAIPSAPVLDAGARDWAAWRLARPEPLAAGQTAPVPGGRYGVTAVETYLQCPFKYFAGRVLALREEAEDEAGLPARDAGLLLHDVLHACFDEWHRRGHTSIHADQLPEARAVFAAVADRALEALPAADRAVERVRLFGSAVATGVLEKMLRVEVERFGDVARRALEHPIDRIVTLPSAEGSRPVHVRGRVDRVDWTTDGDVRVIDYKMGRRPSQSLQPGVYAHAVVQAEQDAGRDPGIAPSGFVAFREDVPWVQAVADREEADEQGRAFVDAVERIESGAFPVSPQNPFRCQFCDYPGVCRKDYVGDE